MVLVTAVVSAAKMDWEKLKETGLGRMKVELRRSIAELTPKLETKVDVQSLVDEWMRVPYYIVIQDNKVFVPRQFLKRAKHIKHAQYVRSALDLVPSPDVMYQYEGGASGTTNRHECGDRDDAQESGRMTSRNTDKIYFQKFRLPFPRLCIAKREGYDKCGVLIPNPYFGNLSDWTSRTTKLTVQAQKRPFDHRDDRLFWRGSIGSHSKDHCAREQGNYARFSAVSLTAQNPTHFDVRCIECNPRDEHKTLCPGYEYDDDMRRIMASSAKDKIIQGAFVEETRYSEYKYVLNLPGSTTGSYSRNLNHLWMLGGVVLLWQNAHVGHYYPALVEGVTHLTVNKSTALSQLASLTPAKTALLRQGAAFVANELLCAKCLASFHREVAVALRAAYRFDLIRFNTTGLVEFLYYDERRKVAVVRDEIHGSV